MPKQATLQVRMDEETKARAEKLFAALGLTLSEAVRLFMAQSVNERRLPFTPRRGASRLAPRAGRAGRTPAAARHARGKR